MEIMGGRRGRVIKGHDKGPMDNTKGDRIEDGR